MFSSLFIEDTSIFDYHTERIELGDFVLVPIYRGYFNISNMRRPTSFRQWVLIPIYRGYFNINEYDNIDELIEKFSSPFIEDTSIFTIPTGYVEVKVAFSSPFIEDTSILKNKCSVFKAVRGFSSPFIEDTSIF